MPVKEDKIAGGQYQNAWRYGQQRFGYARIMTMRLPRVYIMVLCLVVVMPMFYSCSGVTEPTGNQATPEQTSPRPSVPIYTDNIVATTSENQTISNNTNADTPVFYTYEIVNTYAHDQDAFTQGLVFEDGVFYEGTGHYGESTLSKIDIETGEVLQVYKLPDEYFGEGITIYEDDIIQLTWKARTGFVYDKNSLDFIRAFQYQTEGWGITHDGKRLIMSDGSATLFFLSPEATPAVNYPEMKKMKEEKLKGRKVK